MVQVKVTEGILEGELVDNEYGGQFYSFKGIPYAEPPLGDLRFKAPKPAKPWDGIRMAKEHGPICYQFDPIFNKIPTNGSEDCLYLNVYTPEVKPDKSLPVMFFIHGGGFFCGSGNSDVYGPEYLVRQGIILVTFNYRLETLGFLCLDTEDVPGNAGMKDQVAALKWVKNNISNFGGDPENITIFGESAGGASVAFHLISPMSKGLFKRAIAQSGTANNSWTQYIAPKERAIAVAKKLGLQSEDDKELYDFFKGQPLESFVGLKQPVTLSESAKGGMGGFAVVSEKQFGDNERFLHGDVYDILRNGIHEGVEVMYGYTEDEGLLTLMFELEKAIEGINNFHDVLVPKPIQLNCGLNDQIEVSKKFKKYYFNNEDVSIEKWEQYVKFHNLDLFAYAITQWAKICASQRKDNIYFYKFTCKSERNIFAQLIGVTHLTKEKVVVCHEDDLAYLFPEKIYFDNKDVDKTSNTFKLIENVTKLWTNFAKYGNPTPDNTLGVQWTPYTLEKQHYLDIGNELVLGTEPDKEELEFWEGIFRKYLPSQVYNGSKS